jgi:hypothetical protein
MLAHNRGEYPLGLVQPAGFHSQNPVREILRLKRTAPKQDCEDYQNHANSLL